MTKINLVTVSESDMFAKSDLFADMQTVSLSSLGKARKAINAICAERSDYEAVKERRIDGVITVGQSPDIKHIDALVDDEAFARFVLALKIDPRSYLFPQSQDGGKSDHETSNLKSYRKVRQVANLIFRNDQAVGLENVAKVFAVCAYRFAANGRGLLTREWCENFLSSSEFSSIDTATSDLWSAIDDVRAKQMSGGAATQSGQMVRTLVAVGSAKDVREGRAKNVEIDPNGLVLQAMMVRFGQV